MAQVTLKETYRCSEDCSQEGCPRHQAVLIFKTTTTTYIFENGKGDTFHFDHGELQAMVNLIKQMGERRADALQI